MPKTSEIVEKFHAFDAHDDTVEGISIVPAPKRRSTTAVEIILYRHWESKRRILLLTGCVNIGLVVDATILADNAPNNTASVEATVSIEEIVKVMRNHKKSWNVTYEKSVDPLPNKLAEAEKYILFRVRFFGGILEVVAKSFKVRKLNASLTIDAGQARRL